MVSGFTPMIATALYSTTGWTGPAILFSCYGLLGLVATLVTRETWGTDERRAADRAVTPSVEAALPATP
ncbi:hypothetical protein SAZ11_49415 [Streptomyces sp. FXJ1.4098]|nr:hypothetical protein [Streptomyces sp. FXJ1.4098]